MFTIRDTPLITKPISKRTRIVNIYEITAETQLQHPHLPEGQTTVGGHIESSHLKPSKIGDNVKATAEVTKVDGKKIEFKVAAYSGETLLGEGAHLRFIVDRAKFMSRL